MATNGKRLNARSAHGLWITTDKRDGFVVFEHEGKKRAFLLSNFDGRPAYTCIKLDKIDVPAIYDGPVKVQPLSAASFGPANATLGKLFIRGGDGYVTTIDGRGEPIEVQIAPLLRNDEPDGPYFFCWALVRAAKLPGQDPDDDVLYIAASPQSWLNWWYSPHVEDEANKEDGLKPGDMCMQIPRPLVEAGLGGWPSPPGRQP